MYMHTNVNMYTYRNMSICICTEVHVAVSLIIECSSNGSRMPLFWQVLRLQLEMREVGQNIIGSFPQ